MTDRELLELAAKACGYLAYQDGCVQVSARNWKPWRPIADKADAFDVAVQLKLTIKVCARIDAAYASKEPNGRPYSGRIEEVEACRGDPSAATRRAIVRAAAAIGAKGE